VHALQHTPVEYGKRVLRRVIRGQERWYVQVTYAGEPLVDEGSGTVGVAQSTNRGSRVAHPSVRRIAMRLPRF